MTEIHPRVAAALHATTSGFAIIRHADLAGPIRSPQDFAVALGIDVNQIAKSIVVAEHGGNPRLAVLCLSAPARLNLPAISEMLGWGRLELCPSALMLERIDYPKGAVTPLGIRPEISVTLDATLLNFADILIGSGRIGVEIRLTPQTLVQICRAHVANIILTP